MEESSAKLCPIVGKEFPRILLRDVEFKDCNDYRGNTFTLEEMEDRFICVGCSFTVNVIKGDKTLRDDETLEHLIEEIEASYEDWCAVKGRIPRTLCLIKLC